VATRIRRASYVHVENKVVCSEHETDIIIDFVKVKKSNSSAVIIKSFIKMYCMVIVLADMAYKWVV
jgi:hypothetical protein